MSNKKYGTVYVIKNDINDRIYIGSTTKSLKRRFTEHKNTKNRYFDIVMDIIGVEHFYIEPIDENIPIEFLKEKEAYYIELYCDRCYNKRTEKPWESKQKWYAENREHVLSYAKKYAIDNSEKIKAYQKEYRNTHKEKQKEYDHKRWLDKKANKIVIKSSRVEIDCD